MGMLDRLARAETSSDLRHYPEPCAVDVLKAAGLAGIVAPIHLALFRLKFLNDPGEIDACKRIFIRWAGVSMSRRGINPQQASRAGTQALTAWVDDTCPGCLGQKYRVIEGAPLLSEAVCKTCKGTGKRPIAGEWVEVTKDVHERADDAVQSIRGRIEDRLRG